VTITTAVSPFETDTKGITFLELEITGKCNLHCAHCYAESGPRGNHGTMTVKDWKNVIDQAYAHETIVSVQFIGGEPTEHPNFAELMTYALGTGLGVEVYSNLVSVTPELWELYSHPNAYLATSYYSDVPETHDAITRRKGSHAATLMNIKEAVRRGIIIRAGVVEQHPGQRAAEAAQQLRDLGVNVNEDRMRAVGRGDQSRSGISSVTELCGKCAKNNLAIGPNGDVWGCTISRFLPSPGNVKVTSLAAVLDSAAFEQLRAVIPPRTRGCDPDSDSAPSVCGPDVKRVPAAVKEKAAQ
jgi:MoaA/NifB/PqqE/SkfB family radical SAM enzyme